MDSLSRPFHRRKPSNANGFSGKNAYDGVFSDHRPNYDGAPAVNVEEYREIFSTAGSSIPVIDLSNLQESSSGDLKPDYGRIFGGFRDQDIAISYEELVSRDKARVPSSTSYSSQDPGDMSHESFDAMKQFNLSYNKISQRSKDGLDGATHVTQLHAVPGFTCFVDESMSQPNKETEKQKASLLNDVNVNSSKRDFPEKQTSQSSVEFSKHQEESLSDNRNFKAFEAPSEIKKQKPPATSQPKTETKKQTSQTADFKSYPSKVSSLSPPHATNLDNLKNDRKRSTTTNEELPPPCFDEEVAINSAAAALKKAIENAQESIRIAKESVGRKKEGFKRFSSKSFKDRLKVKSRVIDVNADEDPKEKDHKNGNFYDGEKLFGAKKVINETLTKDSEPINNLTSRLLDNNKTVTESIESKDRKNGNFYDGENLYGSKKVINVHTKVSEPVKNLETPIAPCFELNNNKTISNSKQVVGETVAESVENKDYKNVNFHDGVGAKEVINEIHVKVSEPITSCLLDNNKTVCNSKLVVGETETESVENNACENERKDDEVPDGFLELESCEKKQDDTESDNLTVCQKVETEKEILQTSDRNGYEKKSCEESFRLLESSIQENLEQEHDEDEDEDEKQDVGVESHSEEERFYDVYEVETIKNAQTYAYNMETNDFSQKEDYENQKAEEVYENSSSDYDDAEENENVIGASNNLDACKVDQNVDQVESCQDIDDVSSHHEFEVEEKEAYENISSDETEDKTIHCMEIEVKKTVEKDDNINHLQQPHEQSQQTPEIKTETGARPPQEPKDACGEPDLPEPNKETEQARIKLAVERAIREARERAFAEVRQRVIAGTQEKVTKITIDKTAAQCKLRNERALVERATAEARQRALEKLEKQTSFTSQTITDSALRSKAKLEKHNRIMERAAKALAEKEKRDLLALREQAERNRLAEHLDADIKRWSTGKEGNLRALLSTLQYILGADSGWQAVSLTDIITTGAVKKAYRKATLCVHPDKLQQRGASIQQKYICEKVFDLLKAAWNRFNSEER